MSTFYVRSPSKKAINERLSLGQHVTAVRHQLGSTDFVDLTSLSDGDVIKIYSQEIAGTPIAKSYGNWDAKRGRVK